MSDSAHFILDNSAGPYELAQLVAMFSANTENSVTFKFLVLEGSIGRIWQKWNIIFTSMFSLVHNRLQIRITVTLELALYGSAILYLHISTLAQNGQTKHWL